MDTFSALADPTRRHIIEMLASGGRLSAGDIGERFTISPSAISQHLKVLREAKLVQVEKRAQQRIYQLNTKTIRELEDWAGEMRRFWNERFDALDATLKAEMKKSKPRNGDTS